MASLVKNNSFKENKSNWLLLISIWLLYVWMMVSKSIYPAEIIEVIKHFNVDKTAAGYGTTAYYFTYGFMQLVVAKIITKINLRKYLAVTVALSAICTMLIGLSTQLWQIWILSGLNGILHAAIWPSCLFIVARYLPARMQPTANGLLSAGFATGFILSFVFSALFIQIASWAVTFIVFGSTMLPILAFFIIRLYKAEKKNRYETNSESKSDEPVYHLNHRLIKRYLHIFYAVVLITALFQNILYYGMSGWIPSLMYDEFNMPSSMSTFLSVLVPIVGIFGPLAAISLQHKHNLWQICLLSFSIFGAIIFMLVFCYKWNFVLSLALSVIALTVLRGAGNSISSSLVLRTRYIFNAGSFGAVINAFASLGASISPPVTGVILDNSGRPAYYIMLTLITIVTIAFTFACIYVSKKIRVLRNTVLSYD